MTKRIFIILMVGIMALSCAACGKENKKEKSKNISTQESSLDSADIGTISPKSDNVVMEYTFEDSWKDVFFDYPQLQVIEENMSTVFRNSKYVVAYSTKESSVEDIVITDELLPDFQYATKTHILGKVESLKISSEKEIKIGDYELLQIDGSAVIVHSDESVSESVIHGYTFRYDNAIFELIGISRDGSDEHNDEMIATVDAMITTLRHKR